MKIKKLLILAACAGALTFTSCNADREAAADVPESRATAEMTLSEANAMIADLQNNNTFIDLDLDAIKEAGLTLDNATPLMCKARVALYRFYSGVRKTDNNRYRQAMTARDLNISGELYDSYMSGILEPANKFLDDIDARRAAGETVEIMMSDMSDLSQFQQLLSYREPSVPQAFAVEE